MSRLTYISRITAGNTHLHDGQYGHHSDHTCSNDYPPITSPEDNHGICCENLITWMQFQPCVRLELTFKIISLLKDRKYAQIKKYISVITMLSIYVYLWTYTWTPFQVFDWLTDSLQTLHDRYVIRCHINVIFSNFLQLIITTRRTRKLVIWE